jgi:hypothetical protein
MLKIKRMLSFLFWFLVGYVVFRHDGIQELVHQFLSIVHQSLVILAQVLRKEVVDVTHHLYYRQVDLFAIIIASEESTNSQRDPSEVAHVLLVALQ